MRYKYPSIISYSLSQKYEVELDEEDEESALHKVPLIVVLNPPTVVDLPATDDRLHRRMIVPSVVFAQQDYPSEKSSNKRPQLFG